MKKIYSFLVVMLFSVVAFAYDVEIDGIYYNLDMENKTAHVVECFNSSEEIIIPSEVIFEGVEYSVTSIAGFSNSRIKSIIIPNSVISIESNAFFRCSYLKSIEIPNSVTSIGSSAFERCSSLESIIIPNSVVSVGGDAFKYTAWLDNQLDGFVYINNCLYKYKGEMLENTHVDIKEGTIQICSGAFAICTNLTSISIPNSVIEIADQAFSYCTRLTLVTIPNSVTSIGYAAFSGCSSLESITVDINNQNYVSIDGVLYNKNITALIMCPGAKVDVIIPNGVTSIDHMAFYNCYSLTSIEIPNSVTSIGYAAFSGCSSLESITIPNSIVFIDNEAFSYCSKLETVELSNSLTAIGYSMFYNCSSLRTIKIPNGVTSIDHIAFSNCYSLTSIEIPNSVTFIGDAAFSLCGLESIKIQAENPPTICENTFEEVSRVVLIQIPCGSIDKYKSAEYWHEFTNYEEEKHPILTLNVNDETMGFATITKQNSCDDNVAQVQAQALPGYKFVRWSDGSTENPHIVLVTEDMTLTAEFAPEEVDVENVQITSVNVYSSNGILYIEGITSDYRLFDATGKLIYTGRDAQLSLPNGIYLLNVDNKTYKIAM